MSSNERQSSSYIPSAKSVVVAAGVTIAAGFVVSTAIYAYNWYYPPQEGELTDLIREGKNLAEEE